MNYLIALILGYSQLLWVPTIISFRQSFLLFVAAIILPLVAKPVPHIKLLACLLIGYAAGQCVAQSWMRQSSEILSDGRDISISAKVKTYAKPSHDRIQIEVEPLSETPMPFQGVVRLNWYSPSQVMMPGEIWQLNVKVKPPMGLGNPDGFNYMRYLLGKRVIATGYVKQGERLTPSSGWRAARSQVVTQLDKALASTKHRALLKALSVGERTDIAEPIWQLLRETGTVHLIAISGLHVGAVYLCIISLLTLVSKLLLLSERTATIDVFRLNLCIALLGAFFFTLLAGASIPTIRAMVLLSLYTGYRLCYLQSSRWQLLLHTMLIVLLIDPFSVFSHGFWLSIVAVGLIFASLELSSLFNLSRYQQAVLMPLMIFIGMLPIQIIMFGSSSLASPLANMVAIPWVSWFVLPACLAATVLTCFSSSYAAGLWQLADEFVDLFIRGLMWLDSLGMPSVQNSAVAYLVLMACFIFALWYVLPKYRWFIALICCLPVMGVWLESATSTPRFQIRLMDVGQGQAMVIQQGEHWLIYDTGAAYRSGFNMADAVLLPYLQANGRANVDWLMMSHSDNDHAGSAPRLLEKITAEHIVASYDAPFSGAMRCRAGERYQWGDATLQFLSPNGDFTGDNNNSCVVLLEYANQRILLTGDIQEPVETWLAKTYPSRRTDVLLAAHHGSRTSSSDAFIDWAQPDIVLLSAGAWNRWHFPHSQVVKRFQQARSHMYATHCLGQIVLTLQQDKWAITSFRGRKLAPWHHKFGAPPCEI